MSWVLFFSDTMTFSEPNSICSETLRSCIFSGEEVKIRVKNPNHNFFVDTYINDWFDILKSVLILLNLFLVYCAMEPEIWSLLLVLYRHLKNMPKGWFEIVPQERSFTSRFLRIWRSVTPYIISNHWKYGPW